MRIVNYPRDYSEENNSVRHRKKRNTENTGETKRAGLLWSRYRSILSLFYD